MGERERVGERETDLKQKKKLQKRSKLELTSYPRFSVTLFSSLFTLIKKAFAEVTELSFFPPCIELKEKLYSVICQVNAYLHVQVQILTRTLPLMPLFKVVAFTLNHPPIVPLNTASEGVTGVTGSRPWPCGLTPEKRLVSGSECPV